MRSIIVAIGLLASASALSFPAADHLFPRAQKPVVKDDDATCVDFTGDWVGTCTVAEANGQTEEMAATTRIDQMGCGAISFDGAAITPIPATTNETTAAHEFSDSILSTIKWNDDKTVLETKSMLSNILAAGGGFSGTVEATMMVQDGKLQAKASMTSNGLGSDGAIVSRCTYEKKAQP